MEGGSRKDGPARTIDFGNKRYFAFFDDVRARINARWHYPEAAAARGQQGEVILEFKLTRQGGVSEPLVVQSSGQAVLDDAIVRAIREAAPFPYLPADFKPDEMRVKGSFRYVLPPAGKGAGGAGPT